MMKRVLFACATLLFLTASASADDEVTGTVTYRQRIALPPNAVVEVSLQDVSIADVPAKVLARDRIEGPGQVPIEFELKYNPREIDPSHTYSVRADIRVDGKLLFITDRRFPVLTRGNPTSIEIIVVPLQKPPST